MKYSKRSVHLVGNTRAEQAKARQPVLRFQVIEGFAKLRYGLISRPHDLTYLVLSYISLLDEFVFAIAPPGSFIRGKHQLNWPVDVSRHDYKLEQCHCKDIEGSQKDQQGSPGALDNIVVDQIWQRDASIKCTLGILAVHDVRERRVLPDLAGVSIQPFADVI